MRKYRIEYEIRGRGYRVIMANSEEEAEEEFDRIMGGYKPQNEENEWMTSDDIYDLENYVEILETREE